MGKDLKGKDLGKGFCQRKDGTYYARYVDRFGKRKDIYCVNLKELKQKYREAIANNENLTNVRKEMTFSAWTEIWFDVYKKNTVRPNTRREYDFIYKSFLKPVLGDKRLTDIYKTDVQALINDLQRQGYGYERQNKVRILISDICNRAIEDQYLIVNPAKGVRVHGKKSKDSKVLSKEEQAEFLEWAVTSFFYNAFQVEVNTGLRPGELFALTRDSINWEMKTIKVEKTLVYQKYLTDEKKSFHLEDPKTESSKREVPINAVCMEFLKRQIKLKDMLDVKYPTGVPYIFVSSLNNPLESQIYSDAIAAIIRNMNYQRIQEDEMWYFSGHTLRHSFATRCFEAGISPKVVQKYLGHASLQMTMDLYTHVMDSVSSDEIEKICLSDSSKIMGEQSIHPILAEN